MEFSKKLIEIDSIVTKCNIRYHPLPQQQQQQQQQQEEERQETINTDSVQVATNSNTADGSSSSSSIRSSTKLNDDTGATTSISTKDQQLDVLTIQAANEAACEIFLGWKHHHRYRRNNKQQQSSSSSSSSLPCLTEQNSYLIDTRRYKQKFLQHHDGANQNEVTESSSLSLLSSSNNSSLLIKEGDMIVIQESFGKLNFVYVRSGQIYSNRNGHFHHIDFINKPYGSKIRSRNNNGYGFCYLLKPTPELWTKSLNHRTQIIHELDQSQIIYQLYVKPGMRIIESGTGSAAMSYSFIRSIAPTGHLFTYEFNEHRATTARTEFQQHQVAPNLVTVYHRDVCATGFANEHVTSNTIDAVFLDLPEPWIAIPFAAHLLKRNCRIASYSPCIEQTQRTVVALEQYGFHTIQTYEYRLQEHYVDTVQYDTIPPLTKRCKPTVHNIEAYRNKNNIIEVINDESNDNDDTMNIETDFNNDYDGQNTDTITEVSDKKEMDVVNYDDENTTIINDKRSTAKDNNTKNNSNTANTNVSTKQKRKQMLVARPFPTMRGHTAFLTFATSGVCKISHPPKE